MLNLFLFEKTGILLENLVASALHRRYRDQVFFLKSAKTGIDVDFYLPEQSTAIQVCADLNESSFVRETENLVKLKSNLPDVRELFIVTLEGGTTLERSGATIRVIPATEFLLSEPGK